MTTSDLSSLAVEVLHYRDAGEHSGWSIGSGFFINSRLVLTAWHNVDGPGELLVRVHGKEEYSAEVRLQGDKDIDLAVLEVPEMIVNVPPLRYAKVDRSVLAVVNECQAVGFPRFKERVHDPKPRRLSAQVNGEIPTGENLDQQLLTLHVGRSPRPLPSSAIHESEWAGMSGAVVFSGNNIIVGVITEHHLPEGEGALTVVPITALNLLPEAEATKWWKLLGVDRRALVRLPGNVHIDHPTNYCPFPRNTLFQPPPDEFEHLENLLQPDEARQLVRIGLIDKGRRDSILSTYFDSVISHCQRINPTSIAKPASQPLLSVSILLEKIYIHVRAVSDRPLFGMAIEQQQLMAEIELLRGRTDLPLDELEEQIARLKAKHWQSDLGERLLEGDNLKIEDVFAGMKAEHPVSILLGGPGAGKSTTLRWLALQMAHATRVGASLPKELVPAQIPILIRISDYAFPLIEQQNVMSRAYNANGRAHLVKAFLQHELETIDQALSAIIWDALVDGQCLLLFDGLDEVASDSLRQQVAADIYAFINQYCMRQQKVQQEQFNRIIVTSRIVGYESGLLSEYREYTLLDLTDEQIADFLTHWCPAVEVFQATRQHNEHALTNQDRRRLQAAGERQRDELLRAFRDNPGVKQLAVNPLMLTILALIQRSGGKLPPRRVDLYNSITQTLLKNWNQMRGGRRFSSEEIGLAEEALSMFAFEMQRRGLFLTHQRILQLARLIIAVFHHQTPEDIKQDAIEMFITTLSESSGLLVERGLGLYGFMHRTFQEYYAARYMLSRLGWTVDAPVRIDAGDFSSFALAHYRQLVWREPLLFAIVTISEQEHRRTQANALIRAILNASAACNAVLQRPLLFAAACAAECNSLYLDQGLQSTIATRMFDIYGDNFYAGRYTPLQKDIEQLALLWLRGQPAESSIVTPPLLATWHDALCDPGNPQHQEGAVHLLAAIALDLSTCPELVRLELVPPLLQLADVLDIPGIPHIMRSKLPNPPARPANGTIEDYAFIALRLLDKDGPPGWLHSQWLAWADEQPELLTRLSQHSLELDRGGFLLTPAAYPGTGDDPNWQKIEHLEHWADEEYQNWKEMARRDPHGLQRQLLESSSSARYPHAFFYWQLLTAELTTKEPWQLTWDRLLAKELQRGRSATYQTCFQLRTVVERGVDPYYRRSTPVTKTFWHDISSTDVLQLRAITAITCVYLQSLYEWVYTDYRERDKEQTINLIKARELTDLRHLRYMRGLLDLRDLLSLRDGAGVFKYLRSLRYYKELSTPFSLGDMDEIIKLRHLIDEEELMITLCRIIRTGPNYLSEALFALLCVFLYKDEKARNVWSQVEHMLEELEQWPQLSLEQRFLIEALWRSELPVYETDVPARMPGSVRSITQEEWQGVVNERGVDQLDDRTLLRAAVSGLFQSGSILPAEREQLMRRIQGILNDEMLSRLPVGESASSTRLDDELFNALRALEEDG